ncbi:MAG: hypothetical protein LBD41_03140 [Clostridiales Family XIII bacterium]|jgi:hypothetical protein|nr:hypothetical protein [Clostridiales Family XIII bacterium]
MTVEEIKGKLLEDQKWLERGILAIMKYQTQRELASERTIEDNGVGFNGVDGPFLTSLGKWIEKSNRPWGQKLTPKQDAVACKKMLKYAGQLLRIAEGNQ